MISQLLFDLAQKGIYLYLKDGRLAYKAPSNTLTEELKKNIGEKKESIIDFLKLQSAGVSSAEHKIQKINKSLTKLRLSYSQQQLWLLDQIGGGSVHYNMLGELKLSGILDIDAVNLAFTTIFERHESLRTCFAVDEQGEPYQVIQAAPKLQINIQDLSSLEKGTQQSAVAELVNEEAARIFDLSADFMLRVRLLKTGENLYIALITVHHIASDGWSLSILINEFCALYSAYVQGLDNPLPALDIQYADYAYWQRAWLQGEVLDEQLGYWEKQLSGLPVVHSLPLDHSRPSEQSFVGRVYSSRLGANTSKALMELCQSEGATLFMGLHAAFSVLLSRYSNETDIAVGSPIANREQAEVAGLIGFFVNTLVLRSDLSAAPSFMELLRQSKGMLLDAYAHQQVPFEQIVERLQPERNLSHSALFQVMLVLQNNEEGTLELPGLILSPVGRSAACVAKYDLTLNISETGQGLTLGWEYNTDLFEAASIERMAVHFELLLGALVTTPHDSVFSVPMLSEQERHQLLVGWNNTAADYPKDKCVHELFEAQVTLNPEAVAVVFEEQQLTYGELNQKANQLAHYLINEKQVKPDTLVGICVERSLEMVIGILAILKAGGAYVPLDPDYPEARLKYMLADASLTTVLTQQRLRERTPVSDDQAVCLDDDALHQQLAEQSQHNPATQQMGLRSSHLAYVIYTSGSTGNPKGVSVIHHGVVNYLSYIARLYFVHVAGAVVSSPLAFDATVTSLLGPLSVGKWMHIVPQDGREIENLAEIFITLKVATLFKITPAHIEVLGHYLQRESLPNLAHWIIIGGDQLSSKLAHNWKSQYLPQATLVNEYGPTETVVGCSTYIIMRKEQINRCNYAVAIGKAIDNTQLLVLDSTATILPVSVAGELHIGGIGLARGYLNRPDLTAEKFIPNPFYDKTNPVSSERLYKTGDLVRWLPDGNLEFLGRIDDQVKIRGFRIELGEIENALSAHAAVKDAVVVAKESAGGDKRLVGYVVTDVVELESESEEAISARQSLIEELKQHLGQELPDYMVPSVFVLLEKLPLTPNGKVDRKGLPEADVSRQQVSYVAPRTETEKILCGIWQEVLGVERVGIHDNFFQLGGHSLLAMRLLPMVKTKLNVTINVGAKIIFQFPDLQSLAAYLTLINPASSFENIKTENEEEMETFQL